MHIIQHKNSQIISGYCVCCFYLCESQIKAIRNYGYSMHAYLHTQSHNNEIQYMYSQTSLLWTDNFQLHCLYDCMSLVDNRGWYQSKVRTLSFNFFKPFNVKTDTQKRSVKVVKAFVNSTNFKLCFMTQNIHSESFLHNGTW